MADPFLEKLNARFKTNVQLEPEQPPRQPVTQAAPAAPSLPPTITPDTQTALETANKLFSAVEKKFDIPDVAERNQRMGEGGTTIRLDTSSGAPADVYAAISQFRGDNAKVQAIEKLYPGSNPRFIDTGDLVMQVQDSQTGKPKDVVVNPKGMGVHDLLDLAAQAPEIAMGVAVGMATGGVGGFLPTAAQIVLSGLATGTTGYLRDALTRASAGIPIDRAEILRARGADTALDMFFGGGMAVGAKALGRVVSPFANTKSSLQFDFENAEKFFKQYFGESYEATLAEKTGSPMLAAIEAFESKQPGVRTIMTETRERGLEMVRRVQERAVGKAAGVEDLGAEAVDLLSSKRVEPLENALKTAQESAKAKGNAIVKDLLDSASGMKVPGRVSEESAGKLTLKQYDETLAKAQTRVDDAYAVVKSLPGGSGDVLDGSAAARAAKEIREELPAVLKEITRDSELLDEFGRATSVTEQKRILLKSGVPDGLLTALDDLEKLEGGKVSLQTLTNMKKSAHDAIAAFKTAHGDVKDRWFSKIAGAYQEGIEAGVSATDDPALKGALTAAKETYKKELLPFERPGVRELAKEEYDTARLSPKQVVDRMFQGPKAAENYRMLEEVLGPNNVAFRAIKRAWVDTQLEKAFDPLSMTSDAEKLTSVFKNLNVEHPEIAERLFGKDIHKSLQTLAVQGKVQKIESLSVDDLRTLISTPGADKTTLKAVIDARKAKDTAYVNSFLRDIADGLPIGEKMRPMEFVNRLRNVDMPTEDVGAILDTIKKENPKLRAALSDAQAYHLLDRASKIDASTAASSLRGGAGDISSAKLAEAIGPKGTDRWKRNMLLLEDGTRPGYTNTELLENFVKLIAPREHVTAQAFSSGGSLGAGAQIGQLTKKPAEYGLTYAQKALLATMYKDPWVAKAAANTALSPVETAALANYLIASEPFIARLGLMIGDESKVTAVVSNLKGAIDSAVRGMAEKRGTGEDQNQNFIRNGPAGESFEQKLMRKFE